jgi:cellobiose epimerase
MRTKGVAIAGALLVAVAACAAQAAKPRATPDAASPGARSSSEYLQLASELEVSLQADVLAKWFPASIDTEHGGFHQNFREDWSRDPRNDKSIVCQARLTWTASAASLHYPADAVRYKAHALHGLDFLLGSLWDREQGGFYWALDERGSPARSGEKHAYGMAFGIYAACECYRATHDPRALDLAKRAYLWLDAHAHDARNGGYYEALSRAGTPVLSPADPSTPADFIGTHYGYKSMNTHIHLLEALTALHGVWPDAGVRRRLDETFRLVRDRIAVAPGCLNLFFTPDWRPVPDHDSFGHDVETAYLLVEAAAALGTPDDRKSWSIARSLVDHALEYGWDRENGGFYDSGSAFGPPSVTDKIWWTQAEGLNALALMHAHFGHKTSRYWDALRLQWKFIREHQIDSRYGGWLASVDRDGQSSAGRAKGDQWTESYHQARALMTVSDTLRRLAAQPAGRAGRK